jgi:hypothetical protein
MKKTRITVWDYRYTQPPKKYEVDAWCVQGETGFRAFFYVDNMLYEAAGDDGHWWVIFQMHEHWVKEFKEVVQSIE